MNQGLAAYMRQSERDEGYAAVDALRILRWLGPLSLAVTLFIGGVAGYFYANRQKSERKQNIPRE